jgi:hypothetical protein
MRREKILVALVISLLYILAGISGLLDWVRLEWVPAVDFGAFLFPQRGHADGIDMLFSAVVNLVIYGAFVYLIASVLVRLFLKLKDR